MDQIELVRDFNRYYTRRLGVLGDHYLGLSRPWSESRLLFEIGEGVDLRALRGRLGLDSGFLSRLLRSLEKQGLVVVRAHAGDGRVRVASLTAAGVAARRELDARARESVGSLLGQLTPAQRDRLLAAQEEVRRLLRMASVTITDISDSSDMARWCLRQYAAELDERFASGYSESALLRAGELASTGGEFLVAWEPSSSSSFSGPSSPSAPPSLSAWPSSSVSPSFSASSSSSSVPSSSSSVPSSSSSVPPSSSSVPPSSPSSGPALPSSEPSVLSEAGVAVGCGVWQPLSAGVAEIRHVWISPDCRGLGLGRRLLGELESRAGAQGYRTLRLGTNTALPEAAALYRGSGYREIPTYGDSEYNQISFEKVLP